MDMSRSENCLMETSARDRIVGYLIFASIFAFLGAIMAWMTIGGLTFVR